MEAYTDIVNAQLYINSGLMTGKLSDTKKKVKLKTPEHIFPRLHSFSVSFEI